MRTFLLSLTLLCVSALTFSQQVQKNLTAANGTFIGFWEYKPTNYQSGGSNKKYPLIIFLHGQGERGNGTSELGGVLSNAIPKYISQGNTMTFTWNGVTETFLVLSPQLSKVYGSWPTFYVEEMLKYAKANLWVDTDRIYLTGLSLGGGGTWDYVESSQTAANQFAAVAPVCGSSYTAAGACFISNAHLPLWAFHALDDGVVSANITIQGIATVNSCNPNPQPAPISSIYQWGGHAIWDRSYDVGHSQHNPNIYEWFLSKKKSTNNNTQNQPPVANAGSNITTTLPNNSVSLNGTSSYDSDGSISSYDWSYVSGPSSYSLTQQNSANATAKNLVAGVYTFKLTVEDNQGATSSDNVTVTVNTAAQVGVPVAVAGPNQTITTTSTLLNAYGSYSPNGPITSFAWSQLSGPNASSIANGNSSTPTVSGLASGNYVFRLTVTDNVGATATAQVTITVGAQGAPLPPVAIAGQAQNINTATTLLNAFGSYSPNGAITFAWTRQSGPNNPSMANANSSTPSVSGLINGLYVFKLTVTDPTGASASATVNVTVSGVGAALPPVAVAGNAQNITASYTLLNAYGSYSPTGTITGFAWTQVSGPNTAAMANANSSTPSISNMINGAYTFKLTVTDNLGATGTAQTTVTVSGVGTPLPPVAVAGPAQAISSATTSLNAWGSYSPTGTITGFSWAQLSGPNTATMVNANSSTPTISGMKNGIYLFELTVTDNLGVTAKARTTVSVTNVDVISQPVAFAGDPQTVSSNWVLLNAFGSYSPNGPIVSFTWSILQAPNTPLTENMNSSTPTISNLTQGQYKFILTVTDSAGLSATNTTEVNVLTGALPVEITFFKGQRQGEEILLEWATATEQNNDFFAVERSEDGINFVSIGNVKGAGTTNAVTNYSFKDTKPAKGNLYYRLRQVDLDLHSKLSKVVVINASGRKLIEDIYPNPVNDRLVVSILNDSKGNGSIVIYDLSGRVAKKQLIRKDQAAFNTTIQVNDLVPGLYIVEVKVGSDYKIMQKVVKQ